jgi:hypothetical protein
MLSALCSLLSHLYTLYTLRCSLLSLLPNLYVLDGFSIVCSSQMDRPKRVRKTTAKLAADSDSGEVESDTDWNPEPSPKKRKSLDQPVKRNASRKNKDPEAFVTAKDQHVLHYITLHYFNFSAHMPTCFTHVLQCFTHPRPPHYPISMLCTHSSLDHHAL